MTHPSDIPAFQSLLASLTPGDLPDIPAVAAAVTDAQAAISVVPQCKFVIDGLKEHVAALDLKAARVLAGAAHLVLTAPFSIVGPAEADEARDAARVRIAALEAAPEE